MDFSKLYDQFKEYADNRLKSPYFASVLAVWLFINRKIIFGIFNFEASYSLEQRINWIHYQFESHSFLGLQGLEATIIDSIVFGFVIMSVVNLLNGLGDSLYVTVERVSIFLKQKARPSKWVPQSTFVNLEKEYFIAEDELKKKRSEAKAMEKERDSVLELNLKVNQENFILKIQLDEKDKAMENEQKLKSDLHLEINRLTDNINERDRQIHALNIGSVEQRKSDIIRLKQLIPKGQFALNADKQWIYNGTCLVHDYRIEERYQIASDTYRNVYDWEIQLFGRNVESKDFIFNTMIKDLQFEPLMKDSELKGDRIVIKKFNPEENIEVVATELKNLLKRLEFYKAGSRLSIKEL